MRLKCLKNISSIRTVSIDNTLNQYLLEYKSKVEKEKDFSPNMFMFGGVRPYPESYKPSAFAGLSPKQLSPDRTGL